MSKNLYIVPYDFSGVADKALQYALHIGKHVDTEIRIVHLAKDKAKGMVKVRLLNDVKNKLTIPAGVEVTTLVRVGDIFTDIGKIAKKEHAQLIVMGTHGSKGMQWLFGSYAMKILQSADCPFLIVQKNTEIEEISGLVVAIDQTKESMQIVSTAGDMSNIMKCKVNVIAEKQTDQILNTRIQNRVGIIKKEYEERGIDANIEFVAKNGKYNRKVIKYAKQNDIGLIAIAFHSESLFPVFDTFAQKIITNKPAIPVLIVNSKLASALYF